MLGNERRVDHHAYRHKEDRGEHVTHGCHQVLYTGGLTRLRHQRAADERAQRHGITERERHKRGGEADTDSGDQSRLGAAQAQRVADQAGNQQQPDRDEAHQECTEPEPGPHQLRSGNATAGRDGRQDRQQQDRYEVLDDEHAEDNVGDATGDLFLGKGLDDDRGTGDGDDRAEVDALEHGPAERLSDGVPEEQHRAALDDSDEPRCGTYPDHLAEAEFEPQSKHQQDHTGLGQHRNQLAVGGERYRDVGSDDQPGQQVAEDDRLPEGPEQHGGERRDAENQRQVFEKEMGVSHGPC